MRASRKCRVVGCIACAVELSRKLSDNCAVASRRGANPGKAVVESKRARRTLIPARHHKQRAIYGI